MLIFSELTFTPRPLGFFVFFYRVTILAIFGAGGGGAVRAFLTPLTYSCQHTSPNVAGNHILLRNHSVIASACRKFSSSSPSHCTCRCWPPSCEKMVPLIRRHVLEVNEPSKTSRHSLNILIHIEYICDFF